ncbi:hypothetical protein D9758_011761 [Tetrapyrgos nigripes]|uniref:acyl-CoA oxidase n=1 Tax=Tetrapyrgos nigripes TaxID=182062 RepID=A0A8H5CWI7_9AGAR|nr:hypothetical protein D9758_011761 [Tetrapyrgos nigripes]
MAINAPVAVVPRRRRHSSSNRDADSFVPSSLARAAVDPRISVVPPPRPKSTPAEERPAQRRRQKSPVVSDAEGDFDGNVDYDVSSESGESLEGEAFTNSIKKDSMKRHHRDSALASPESTSDDDEAASPVNNSKSRPTRPLPSRKMDSEDSKPTTSTLNPHAHPFSSSSNTARLANLSNPHMLPQVASVPRGPSAAGAGINSANTPRRLFVVLEKACLEAYRVSSGSKGGRPGKPGKEGEVKYTLLNCDDHQGILAKTGRDIADARPDITHQCLLTLLDSPLNKAGLLQVYIHTAKGVLIEVNPHVRIPRTFKRFSGLMVQLLHKLSIRGVNGSEKLLKVVKNPVTDHFPPNTYKITLSGDAPVRKLSSYLPTLPQPAAHNIAVFVGAMARGKDDFADQYVDEKIGLSGFALSASVACGKCEGLRAYHHQWVRKDKIMEELSKDPVFSKEGRDFMTRTEKYTRGLRMIKRVAELGDSLGWTKEETRLAMHSLDESLPISLHTTAFEPVFLAQASPTLLSTYAPLADKLGIFGCYLQTELGHGSNVSGLETTATYISETQEFEIHSPTLSSSKWWIGALGKTATHGVVQAQLILPDGKGGKKSMGPHLFFVQLRSLETHRLLPGITAGDIGPKAFAGFAATDNGFARFNHVRIPKENMLSKFAQVTDKGEYVKPPHAKISYGGMLYIRSGMVTSSGWLIARAAVISIRYGTVRRQGNKRSDGLESQVISYPSLYVRLMPILARAYVYIELGRALTRSFNSMSERLAAGDTSLLAELHATTSGLKSLCTAASVADAENARRSMGGHGYSAFSGIGRAYADLVPSVTFEGENFVLDQQAVRAALKAYRTLFTSGKAVASVNSSSLPPSTAYLRLLLTSNSQPPALTESSWTDPETLTVLIEWRAAAIVRDFAVASASEKTDMWNVDATIYQRVSKAVTESFVAGEVSGMFKTLDEDRALGQGEKQVLKKLYTLFLLTTIEASLSDFLSFGLLRISGSVSSTVTDPTRSLRQAISTLCKQILPEAIGLTDAFGFSDWDLDSALGRYDGDTYQALWERAQTEPLNQKEVSDAYEESIKPMLQRGQRLAKMGAKL